MCVGMHVDMYMDVYRHVYGHAYGHAPHIHLSAHVPTRMPVHTSVQMSTHAHTNVYREELALYRLRIRNMDSRRSEMSVPVITNSAIAFQRHFTHANADARARLYACLCPCRADLPRAAQCRPGQA